MNYCKLCGNEHVTDQEPCAKCVEALRTLPVPHKLWLQLGERQSRCCGGFNTAKTGLHFHGKHWASSYPPEGQSVTVEMGVEFRKDGAHTYYIRDFDSYCDSEEYGPIIPYTKRITEAFWHKLDIQLDKAAEAAWNADLLTCAECGYHYHSANGPCHAQGAEQDEEL
jgi:hypothetical protein